MKKNIIGKKLSIIILASFVFIVSTSQDSKAGSNNANLNWTQPIHINHRGVRGCHMAQAWPRAQNICKSLVRENKWKELATFKVINFKNNFWTEGSLFNEVRKCTYSADVICLVDMTRSSIVWTKPVRIKRFGVRSCYKRTYMPLARDMCSQLARNKGYRLLDYRIENDYRGAIRTGPFAGRKCVFRGDVTCLVDTARR